jgi:DNA-binding NarL/FixJ family response regulator
LSTQELNGVTRQADHRERFDPLTEFMVEDILNASDEQLLAEVAEDHNGDPEALATEFESIERGLGKVASGPQSQVIKSRHILVVGSHPIVCEALGKYIEGIDPRFSSQSAFTIAEAIAIVTSDERPDLVFLDLNLYHEGRHGAEVLEDFQLANHRHVPVVVLTGLSLSQKGTAETLRRCMAELRAQTVLMKSDNLEIMLRGLPRILEGERWLSDELLTAALQSSSPPPALTPRQLAVARAITRGLSHKDIAKELKLYPDSLKSR